MAKHKSKSQKRRRAERRKKNKSGDTELIAWLHDKSSRKEFNGRSAHEVFAEVGLKTVSALRDFLAEPDMQAYLKISALKNGESVQVKLRGVEYMAFNDEGRLRITDDVDMFKRVNVAFDSVVPTFKNAGDIQTWIRGLPKWATGSEADESLKRMLPAGEIVKDKPSVLEWIDKKVPAESVAIVPAKSVPIPSGDRRKVNGHTVVDAVVECKILQQYMNGVREHLPKGVVFGQDFKASTAMVGMNTAHVHWYALTDAGDRWLDAMTNNLTLPVGTKQIGESR